MSGIYFHMKFKKINAKSVFTALLTAVTLASLILTPVFCRKGKAVESDGVKYEAIINVWHIDTFDGGVGSRAAFLQKRADEFTKTHKSAPILVTSRTCLSVAEDFKRGVYPDAVSYGIGGIDPSAFLPLKRGGLFGGGAVNGKFYGAAYLRGQYFLFSKTPAPDFNAGGIMVYSAENYSTISAAAAAGIKGKFVYSDKAQAARRFLNDENACFIGTQRDLYRLKAANAEFTATPISEFCDLYQYLSIITDDEVKNARIVEFLDYLLSDAAQKKVFGLMMLPIIGGITADDADADLTAAYSKNPEYTLSPYLMKSEIEKVKSAAEKTLDGGEAYTDKRAEFINLLKHL